jgi:hypothetical protein
MANILNRVSGMVGRTGKSSRGGGIQEKAADFVSGFLSGGDQPKRRGRGGRRAGGRRTGGRRGR